MSTTGISFWSYYGNIFRQTWQRSKWFRALFIVAAIWAALRLIAQIILTANPVSSQLSVDLQVYLDAAKHFAEKVDLYPRSLDYIEYHFPYPPPFAFLFTIFLKLPPLLSIFLNMALHILAYYILFVRWGKIFHMLNLEKASETLIRTLPLWFLFAAFWGDLIYLNIYTIMALLGTLLIEAILEGNLRGSVLWLTLILLTKPHFAFAAILPLLLGRYKFFFKLLLWTFVSYVVVSIVTLLAGGIDYVWAQYQGYFHLLTHLGNEFPWRGPADGFLGYNHSIKQIFAFFVEPTDSVLSIATWIKTALLLPVAGMTMWHILRPTRREPDAAILEMALLLYLGAFIWLDIVWEAFLSIAIFGYLLSILKTKWGRITLGCVFVPYAIVDAWRLIAYAAGSPMINDAYLQLDYSMYAPIIMFVILTFYAVLLIKHWPRLPRKNNAVPRLGNQ